MLRIAEIEYLPDSLSRFQAVRDRPWPVLLDSGGVSGVDARFDIVAADPFVTLVTRGAQTEIRSRDESRVSRRDPLELVREQLGERIDAAEFWPFAGGAIGYFAYDLGRRFERMPDRADADIALPEMAVGIYDWAVMTDHRERRSCLLGVGRDRRTFEQWDTLLERLGAPKPERPRDFEVTSAVRASYDFAAYAEAFRAVKRHISDGDCYQVNLTQRFSADVGGDPWQAYLNLRQINPAPFSAYLDVADAQILCSSPERFLRVEQGFVQTKPIKGTRPRAGDPVRDRALAEELRSSRKDRAENVMIVDLLRNDLGKNCAAGSIEVDRLFDIESFASVHHLVSTVTGRLSDDKHAVDLLRGCFPGGSITGAPKVRAMQIIEEIEPQRRSVYCGSIGYIGFDGNMDSNIAIRTMLHHRGAIHAWAGGGIVADSELESEYQESLDKAGALLEVLQGNDRRAAS